MLSARRAWHGSVQAGRPQRIQLVATDTYIPRDASYIPKIRAGCALFPRPFLSFCVGGAGARDYIIHLFDWQDPVDELGKMLNFKKLQGYGIMREKERHEGVKKKGGYVFDSMFQCHNNYKFLTSPNLGNPVQVIL